MLTVYLDSLREGQTVGCMVSREGELHVYINGVDNGIVWTGLPTHKPFWGVADVFACTTKIQLVSGEWLLSIAVSHVPHPLHHLPVFIPLSCSLALSESDPLHHSKPKPQEPDLHQQNTRLQQEVTSLLEEVTHLQQDYLAQRFHSRCGKNISLSDNNTVAARQVRSEINDGTVFTEQPVELGTVFQVKILKSTDAKQSGPIVSG